MHPITPTTARRASAIVAIALLSLGATSLAQYAITASTIDGGGGTLTGSTYAVSGTVGQPDASPTTIGATYEVTGGFWTASPPPCLCVADLDDDCDTDVFDFAVFAPNFGATGLTPNTGGDFDGDGDVDVFDFAVFAPGFGCGS